MTRTTIPRNLKKKLSASLENLTPRQAGRLFLILFHEAHDKGFYALDYPPLKDLEAAWERRIDQAQRTASKNPEAAAQEARLYNGWLFLRSLVGIANLAGSSDVWPLLYKVQYAFNRIDRLLLVDAFSDTAGLVAGYLTNDELPRPASRDEYARLTAYATEDGFEALGDVAVYLAEDWWERQDRTGDREELDAALDAKEAELEAALVALWEAGDLDGGLAVSLRACGDPVLLEAGTIPAWAALRAVWGDWLYDQDCRQQEDRTPHPKALEGVYAVYHIGEGDVEGDDLARLAGAFLADCKKRPWGRNLPAPKTVDLAALGFFLTTVDTPLTAGEAPDLGRVDWDAFRKSEKGAAYRDGEPYPVATVRSLKAGVAALGAGDYAGFFWLLDQYYPTDRTEYHRQHLARILRLLRSMRVSHRTFVHSPQEREDTTLLVGDLVDFLGVSFYTPLEEAVRFLGEVFGEVATFRRTYDLLADEYFGGLPLLHKGTRETLDQVDTVLAEADVYLADWLKSLEGWPWGVDTTSLKLVKADVDEDLARRQADDTIDTVLARAGFKRHGYDLGPEEPPAKGKSK